MTDVLCCINCMVNQDEKVEEGVKVHRAERSSAFVRRSLRLPEHADLSKVSAKYENGVLKIEVRLVKLEISDEISNV